MVCALLCIQNVTCDAITHDPGAPVYTQSYTQPCRMYAYFSEQLRTEKTKGACKHPFFSMT